MLGYHLLVDCYSNKEYDKVNIKNMIYDIIKHCDMKIMNDIVFVDFEGENAFTGFVVIAESHISIHTYPEKESITIDVYSCKDFDYKFILDLIRITLGCKIRYDIIKRG